VGEILIRRDDRNRVTGLVLRDVAADTLAGGIALHLLQAVTASLVEYLHLSVESNETDDGTEMTIDRCDTHLDRELDAVLETLVIGLKSVEREHPTDLVVEEPIVGVEV
jgi:hypothetical protein